MIDEDGLDRFKADDLLMWLVTGPTPSVAESRADEFQSRAIHYRLGECEKYPAGLGASWWFDLTLAEPVDHGFIVCLFGRMPDHIY